jgi:hypothetical protein
MERIGEILPKFNSELKFKLNTLAIELWVMHQII